MNGLIRFRLPVRLPFILPRSSFVLLSAFALILFTVGINSRSLWASHEARTAQNAQRMLDDGDWLVPRLYDGQAELQKPPGYYWLAAAVGALRGHVDEFSGRPPAGPAGRVPGGAVFGGLCQRGPRPWGGL